MAGETIENAYDLENSLRRIARTPVSMQAVPDTSGVIRTYAAGEAEKATQEQDFANRLTIGEKALAEKTRQFDTNTAEKTRQFDTKTAEETRGLNANYRQAVDMMHTWEKQNKWSTGLGLLNLGVQGLSFAAQNVELKKTEEKAAELARKLDEQITLSRLANEELRRVVNAHLGTR